MTPDDLAVFERLAAVVRYRDACAQEMAVRWGARGRLAEIIGDVWEIRNAALDAGGTYPELRAAYLRGAQMAQNALAGKL